ncbi:O-antigen polymerase [Paenimyroides aestuarii]|uniref:Oligosaccharide repeat unit polymerase n=1 Tax=Paenimyroides aestuarii TaxID=2968490 RepID=A0ABY5NS19_9FLAO|nr:O-antigen polymerase [Paenimyroides aestuarii]UUV21272.1 oligosaccharide repeat unit polymerase [Paenimyroides aestuarii]
MNIIFIISTILCFLLFYNPEVPHFSTRVFLSSYGIQIFTLYHIFHKKNKYVSLNLMINLFFFFFFGIAPLLQFYQKTVIFGGRILNEYEYFNMNILIIAIILLYSLMYNFFTKTSKKSYDFSKVSNLSQYLAFTHLIKLSVISTLCFILVFYLNNFNVFSLLVRGGESSIDRVDIGSTSSLIVSQFIRPIPIISFCIAISTRKNKNWFLKFYLFIIAILTTFPLGVPRFYAAAVYIPVLCIVFKKFRDSKNFALFFIISFLIIFPFLENFRHLNKYTKLELKLDYSMFGTGNFDSYYNFAIIVLENYITYGKQLLGVIFFWVPRSYWSDKPVGSGYYIAYYEGYSFNNVSANFFAEGYINFGYLGIVLFIFILAYLSAKLDVLSNYVLGTSSTNIIIIPYFILLGMIFFMLRGDLLSSFSFTVGYILSFYFIYKFILK